MGETSCTNATAKIAAAVCEECKINASKYKCPGCSIRSCSLPCVKAHKQRTDCTGKRQQTQFLPLSQFDDNVLLSDYNMLEDVKRVAESAERMRVKLCGNSHFRLPHYLKSLQRAATNRRTKLLFLPIGMAKRETNQTFYNQRKKSISWTIEWRFHSTDVTLIDHGVNEKSNFCSVIENHLKPGPRSYQLKQFCLEPLESLKFFISKHPKGAKSPFRELDIKASMREQLANLVIIEYPVIHVFLPSQSYNFEVIKEPIPRKVEPKESISRNQPSPKGVFFKEEEIEDDSSLDPKVLDLMKHAKPDGVLQISSQPRLSEKRSNKTLDKPQLSSVAEGSERVMKDELTIHEAKDIGFHSSTKSKEPGVVEYMDFDFDLDFEEGLMDAYSNLISGTNPDEFLDLESILSGDLQLDERKGQIVSSRVVQEELEEGEIPGF